MIDRRFVCLRLAAPLLAAMVLAAAVLFLLPTRAQAGPAAPVDFVFTQPDGAEVTLRPWGDEWMNGLETPEGYTVLLDESSGYMVYAAQQPDGSLGPALVNDAPLIVGRDDPSALPLHATPTAETPPEMQRAPAAEEAVRGPFAGTVPVLIILADFNDQTHVYNSSDFQAMAFGASNSIKDFYAKASFNQLNLVPATESQGSSNDGVVGWVSLGINHPNPSTITFAASSAIARAALTAANPYIYYRDYDHDGDGYVTSQELQVVIFAAGYEKSITSPPGSRGIWAHQWDLTDNPLTLDGVKVGQTSADGNWGGYAITGERHSDHRAAIGTAIHEFGHLLSWPDLYDISNTDGDYTNGVGNWSIMGYGSWNGTTLPGDTPALPDAFLKWYQGWLTPTKALGSTHYNVASAYDHAQAVLVGSNPGGVDWDFYKREGFGEYWLVENRQRSGYDAALPGCGLLVWHIHEDISQWNDANARWSDRLVGLEQADGSDHLRWRSNYGDASDPYPGSAARYAFDNNTTPNSRFNSGASSMYSLAFDHSGCGPSMGFSLVNIAPSRIFLPIITQSSTLSGVVTDNGTPVSGQTLKVLYSTNDGASYQQIGTVKTDSGGKYSVDIAPMNPHDRYYVLWSNPAMEDYNGRLYYFRCNPTTYPTGSHTCNINLRDIKMISPAPRATISWPNTFTWTRRATTTDSYELRIFSSDAAHTLLARTVPALGYTDRVTIPNAPNGTKIGTQYLWSMYVYTPYGEGDAYYWRTIYWRDLSGPALNGEPLAGWEMGVVDEVCPAEGKREELPLP